MYSTFTFGTFYQIRFPSPAKAESSTSAFASWNSNLDLRNSLGLKMPLIYARVRTIQKSTGEGHFPFVSVSRKDKDNLNQYADGTVIIYDKSTTTIILLLILLYSDCNGITNPSSASRSSSSSSRNLALGERNERRCNPQDSKSSNSGRWHGTYRYSLVSMST